ncbi:hypothetical protein BBF96_12855 [Anoxybacter fermentans]|uniref:ABC transporter domain-containing protein n=1 Tax=Anoxybacter fermentans TaxID=1323375 RepID=A0A3S9T0Z1_9FIRM|nr:ATP-binding cassette domain-containing protein [Anoxybacter fermentans]AZR74209.1 hypothetical protein BBF96_12855 [Anoxybacter fermentans]
MEQIFYPLLYQLNYKRICRYVLEENTRSQRLYEKIGFKREGSLGCCYFKDGKYQNAYLYFIINGIEKIGVDNMNRTTDLRIENVSFYYPDGKCANKNINLEINRGEIFGLLGPNGAGKTTLMKQIIGTLISSKGEIYVSGFNVRKEWNKIKPLVGYQSQFLYGLNELKVKEILYYTGLLKGLSAKEAKAQTNYLIDFFGMESFKDELIFNLSGGMRKITNFCLSIINNPRILLLDEPTTGIDPDKKQKIWEFLHQKTKEKEMTIFITSHNINEMEKFLDRVAIIINGEIKFVGTPTELKKRVNFEYILTIKGKIENDIVERYGLISTKKDLYEINLKNLKDVQKILNIILDTEIDKIEDIKIESTTLEDAFIQFNNKYGYA